MVKITNMYQNNDDDSFPTEALREGRKAAKGIRKSKAVEDIFSVDTETNKYSIEELQKYMNNSFE
jgi:hypothetical protein